MNVFEGKIASIKTNGSVSLVTLHIKNIIFDTIVIETPDSASYLRQDTSIKVMFKETEVIIGKGDQQMVSIRNKVDGNILEIKKGELLSKITINTIIGNIVAIITTSTILDLELKPKDLVTVMIKTTEIMLSE